MSALPREPSSAAPDDVVEQQPHVDASRMRLEPKRYNKTKMVFAGAVAFVVLLGLVFLFVTYARSKFTAFTEERVATQAERKARAAESPSARKAIDFGSLVARRPSELTAATPAEAPATAAASAAGTAAPIALKNGSTPAPVRQAPPKPSMMLDAVDMDGAARSNAAAATTMQAPKPPPTTEALMALLAQARTATASTDQPVMTAGAAGADAPSPRTVQEVAERSRNKGLTGTRQVSAANLGDAGLVITRGHHLPCVLETQIVSNLPGTTACILTENVYSTNGKVLLLEKGTRAVGEYKTGLRTGDTRLAILWDRVETPTGVVIDLDSPSADMVGAAGVPGWVDNHWFERIGAAFLLSYVQDAIQYKTTQATPPGALVSGPSYSNTTGTGSALAEKVLNSTINIAPTLIKNRGDLITIEVRHDLWFQDVYSVR